MPDKFSNRTYSRLATQETFNRLKKHFPKRSWLGVSNRYAKNCTEAIERDCPRGRGISHRIIGPKKTQLAEYIAASVPLHCMDGWSFLGKAIISHATGDNEASKHFAYYAQLRAVMSLLASEGIGVFSGKHFSIKNLNGKSFDIHGPISERTHSLVRKQFFNWIGLVNSGRLFQKIIRPRGIHLNTWFSEISTSQLNYLAKDWLKHWGYDIATLGVDQSAREHASYRPSSLFKDLSFKNSVQIRNSLAIVENIWRMCEMDGGSGGFNIDTFLLRKSWEKYNGKQLSKNKIEPVLDNLGINEPEKTTLTQLLSRTTQKQDPILLIEASKRGMPHDPDYHVQMMSRAALLLRLATGSGTQMIENARYSKDDLKFWWENLGENYGLWDSGQSDPISDMWVEVEAALSSMVNTSSVNNHYQWRTGFATELLALAGCERIPLSQFCL